jgi:hypothetical protein
MNVGDCFLFLWVLIFILKIIFNILVGSLYEDLGEDSESWTHVSSTLTTKLMLTHANYFHINFPPTLIGLCSVVINSSRSLIQQKGHSQSH